MRTLEKAVDCAISAKFATSGQDCLGANRFFIQAPVYDAFCQAFAERTAQLTVGPGLEDPDIGPLMNEAAVAKQEAHVEDALARGARLLTGGKVLDQGPLFYAPTVLADVPPAAAIFNEETFGPVAALAAFDSEEEVLRRANDTEYGLVAYLHSEDPRRIYRASRALQFGMVAVNRTKVTGAPYPLRRDEAVGSGPRGCAPGLGGLH